MDDARITKRLDYLKAVYPKSAPALQAAQDFREAMAAIQSLAGESSQSLKSASEAIKAMAAKEQKR